jgi:proline iminopeptidase
LCDTAATLAPLPDDNPPPSLAERAPAESMAAAARLFCGDFSPEGIDTLVRLVAPYYAAPEHMEIPRHLMSLTGFAGDIAGYFFSELAPHYDLRRHLSSIAVPTLVIVGGYDWVCPPAASRILAAEIPGAELVEIAGAGHFPFSEEPRLFGNAVHDFLGRLLVWTS